MSRTKQQPGPECVWTPDPDTDSWDTACQNKHCFTEGGPRENSHAFCPYCGRALVIKKATR